MTERERDAEQSDIVESAGETTAAATGPAERGAAGADGPDDKKNRRPVGADTRVRVEGEAHPGEED